MGRARSVLTIAGSDSGGGAGIQADLKTFAAHGLHGLSAVAALTAQNTRGVTSVHVPPVEFLGEQIDACFDDFQIDAIKIGMLSSNAVIALVADAIRRHRPRWVVLDPVMVATSGAKLLDDDALDALRHELMPLASLVTPNIPEAELLLGHAIEPGLAGEAAMELAALGAPAVLLKGGHLPSQDVVDRLLHEGKLHEWARPRLDVEGHGTGCTLAAALACNLAASVSLPDACRDATAYVHGALRHAYRPGTGKVAVLDHFWRFREAPAGG